MEEAPWLFGQCKLFRGLGPDERKALVARARVRNFAQGETIFLMGSSGNAMMAVLSGTVRISVPSADGREIVLAILQPGEVFGEIALLDGKERTADARAASACSLAILDRREVMAFFERHPNALLRLVEALCERLRHTDQHIAEIALLELPVRLAKAMLRIVNEPSFVDQENPQIHLSQRELGNMVGAARESVNKCIREWQRAGVVRVDEGVITVKSRTALEELAERA